MESKRNSPQTKSMFKSLSGVSRGGTSQKSPKEQECTPKKYCDCKDNQQLRELREELGLDPDGYRPGTKNSSNTKLTKTQLIYLRDRLLLSATARSLTKFEEVVCRWPRPSELRTMFDRKTDHVQILRSDFVFDEENNNMGQLKEKAIKEFIGKDGVNIQKFTKRNKLIYAWVHLPNVLKNKRLVVSLYFFDRPSKGNANKPNVQKHGKLVEAIQDKFDGFTFQQSQQYAILTEIDENSNIVTKSKKLKA